MNNAADGIAPNFLRYLSTVQANPGLDYTIAPLRLHGGYETTVYHFQLKGAAGIWAKPLILRLYPERFGAHNAIWESTIQTTLANAGYPVPRSHLVCTDPAILGGAFFVMDYLDGAPLITAPKATVPELLGKSHARLHQIDPRPLTTALSAQQIEGRTYSLDSSFDRLQQRCRQHPHFAPILAWLVDNRPAAAAQRAVCHGDFHPLNILIKDGALRGVIDWPGFAVADPVMDVATTLILATIPTKYLAPQLGLDFTADDVTPFVQGYLAAYETVRPLDRTNLPYYQAFRALQALMEGADGQTIWQHLGIVQELKALLTEVTGLAIEP